MKRTTTTRKILTTFQRPTAAARPQATASPTTPSSPSPPLVLTVLISMQGIPKSLPTLGPNKMRPTTVKHQLPTEHSTFTVCEMRPTDQPPTIQETLSTLRVQTIAQGKPQEATHHIQTAHFLSLDQSGIASEIRKSLRSCKRPIRSFVQIATIPWPLLLAFDIHLQQNLSYHARPTHDHATCSLRIEQGARRGIMGAPHDPTLFKHFISEEATIVAYAEIINHTAQSCKLEQHARVQPRTRDPSD